MLHRVTVFLVGCIRFLFRSVCPDIGRIQAHLHSCRSRRVPHPRSQPGCLLKSYGEHTAGRILHSIGSFKQRKHKQEGKRWKF
jgi:hypothetical protein